MMATFSRLMRMRAESSPGVKRMMLASAPVAMDTITIPQKHAIIATNLRNNTLSAHSRALSLLVGTPGKSKIPKLVRTFSHTDEFVAGIPSNRRS